MSKTVLITTLGCKVNQYESAAFKTGFENAGLEVVSAKESADIVVVNTCAVTAPAGAQSRQAIRKAIRQNPDAQIVITGCYAEISAKELSAEKDLQGRSYTLIGNSKKDGLVTAAINMVENSHDLILGAIQDAKEICRLPVRRFGDRSRAYLRVQDGCESYCTYCIVPYTRGPSRSLPLNEVLDQAQVFAAQGHREMVLTGIHLGYYGKDLDPKVDIISLLDKLSRATPDTHYRISSLEPTEITIELLGLMKSQPNIQPHLHIPLQSGHDEILSKMNRNYTIEQFKNVIDLCHAQLPGLAIGVDILAGFPGETDLHFAKALGFLKELDFSYLHVFPYSIRPGTEAANFPDQLPKSVKDERVAILRELSADKLNRFYKKHIGQHRSVLIEGRRDSLGRLKGFTDNYIAVRFEGPDSYLGDFCEVELDSLEENYVIGKRIEPYES